MKRLQLFQTFHRLLVQAHAMHGGAPHLGEGDDQFHLPPAALALQGHRDKEHAEGLGRGTDGSACFQAGSCCLTVKGRVFHAWLLPSRLRLHQNLLQDGCYRSPITNNAVIALLEYFGLRIVVYRQYQPSALNTHHVIRLAANPNCNI